MAQKYQELIGIQFPEYKLQNEVYPNSQKLHDEFIPSRIYQTKKPSAFRSNSSNSSKQKHVGFSNQHSSKHKNTSRNSRQRKRYSSFKGKANESDLSIEDITSQKNQSEQDSRILIHLSTNKTLGYQSIKQSLAALRKIKKSLESEVVRLKKCLLEWFGSFGQQMIKRIQNSCNATASQQLFEKQQLQSKLARLQGQLRIKMQQNKQIAKQLDGLQIQSKKSIQRIKQENHSKPCPNCKIQQIKINSMREDALQSSKKISQLSQENQALQEKLFDLEQQVIGIDLEVEKKFKAALASISSLTQPQENSQQNHQLIESLTNNIEILTKRCQRYEQICKSQEQLKRRQSETDRIIKQYQLKNASLLEALARSQETNDRNYQREHQILLAQEQICKKLQYLRQKQAELSEWETSLSQKRLGDTNHIPGFQPAEQDFRNLSEVTGPRTMNRNKKREQEEQYYSDYRVTIPEKAVLELQVSKNQAQLSQRSLIHHEQSMKSINNMRITRDNIRQNYYNQRNNADMLYPTRPNRDTQLRKLNPSYSNKTVLDRKHLEEKASIKSKYQIKKLSPSYRDRSSSPSLSFRSSNISYGTRGTMQPNKNLSGLENKLDRLRDELKRQLESIK